MPSVVRSDKTVVTKETEYNISSDPCAADRPCRATFSCQSRAAIANGTVEEDLKKFEKLQTVIKQYLQSDPTNPVYALYR